MTISSPSILLIYTGGTIGMIENPETGALESFNFDHLLNFVPELKRFNCRISTYSFEPPIDSSDMEPYHWARLTRIVERNYNQYDGFVILHGTDTMAYTASALSFMLENLSKPVILTGSQLPMGMLRTDGKENLITAIEIAAAKRPDGTAMVPEVCIYFERDLMRGNRTTKISAEKFNAFKSYNYPCLGHSAIDIKFKPERIRPYDPERPLKAHYLYLGVPHQRTEGRGHENVRIWKRAPKTLAHPAHQRSRKEGHHHRQHHPVSFRKRGNGTLRNGAATAGSRGGERVRLYAGMRPDETHVPIGAQPAYGRGEAADEHRLGGRNHSGIKNGATHATKKLTTS